MKRSYRNLGMLSYDILEQETIRSLESIQKGRSELKEETQGVSASSTIESNAGNGRDFPPKGVGLPILDYWPIRQRMEGWGETVNPNIDECTVYVNPNIDECTVYVNSNNEPLTFSGKIPPISHQTTLSNVIGNATYVHNYKTENGTYSGYLNKDNKPHGYGKLKYEYQPTPEGRRFHPHDGKIYSGEFVNGKPVSNNWPCLTEYYWEHHFIQCGDRIVGYDGEYVGGEEHGKCFLTLYDEDSDDEDEDNGPSEIVVGQFRFGTLFGEGARWNKWRNRAWRLKDGKEVAEISLAEAEQIAGRLCLSLTDYDRYAPKRTALLREIKFRL